MNNWAGVQFDIDAHVGTWEWKLWRQLPVKVLCKHLDFVHGSVSFLEGKKLIHSFHIHEKNSLKIFWSLNSTALIDQTKACSGLPSNV